jgi:hypothetical protein
MKDVDDVIGISATCNGVVEHGIVETIIEDKRINFTVEQYSDGGVVVLLDDNTEEVRELLKEYGAEFENDNETLVYNKFTSYINTIYCKTGETTSASWTNPDYEDYAEVDND